MNNGIGATGTIKLIFRGVNIFRNGERKGFFQSLSAILPTNMEFHGAHSTIMSLAHPGK